MKELEAAGTAQNRKVYARHIGCRTPDAVAYLAKNRTRAGAARTRTGTRSGAKRKPAAKARRKAAQRKR